MNIVILTFYFRPDLSAGSFRNTALVEALQKLIGPDDRLHVITTMPNRYQEFTAAGAPALERHGNVTIHRIAIASHASGIADQSRSYVRYAWQAFQILRGIETDMVFASSSRLMTAALGSMIARWKRAPLYLDIRDLFTDALPEILGGARARLARGLFARIEAATFRRANRINIVSQGFKPLLQARYPHVPLSFFPNGVDADFQAMPAVRRTPGAGAKRPRELLYAGNIGQGQGLEKIIPALARALGDGWTLTVIGAGGTAGLLKSEVAAQGLSNVALLAPMERTRLVERYAGADCLFLHLNDYAAFHKVLPSKVFEYAATHKPILAGVAGHAAQFLRDNVDNVAVFPPCDIDGALAGLDRLSLKPVSRHAFVRKYARQTIMEGLARDILRVMQPHS